MFHGLPPINDLFDEAVTNELNTSFQQIQEKIEDMKVPKLKYKFEVNDVAVYSSYPELVQVTNRSFKVGRELIIDFDMMLTDDLIVPLADTYKVANISEAIDRYYGTVCTATGNIMYQFAILNSDIVISGSSESINGTTFHKDLVYHFYGNMILAN